jgi:glutamate-1-semialdehyde 2,1-aminomutase
MAAMTHPFEAPASEALFDRARAVIPGGVNSPVRAFQAVGGTPRFMASAAARTSPTRTAASTSTSSARGGRSSSGTPTRPSSRRCDRGRQGTSFGTPSRGEVDLAELIVDRVAPVEQVRW